MDINTTIAQNVKQAREQKKLTLEAAAGITGVSRSMLAQIEKGDVNPTISVLWKIAGGYKVSFTSLVEPAHRGDTLIPCAQPIVDEGNSLYRNFPTFPFDEQRLFEMYRICIEEGGRLDAQPHLAGSEEYITVFQGSLTLVLEESQHHLALGDSLRFRADQPHSYQNPGPGPTALSMLIYYNK